MAKHNLFNKILISTMCTLFGTSGFTSFTSCMQSNENAKKLAAKQRRLIEKKVRLVYRKTKWIKNVVTARQLESPYEKRPFACKNLLLQREACKEMAYMVDKGIEAIDNPEYFGPNLFCIYYLINGINEESFYSWSFISNNYNKFLLLALKLTKCTLEFTNIGLVRNKFCVDIPAINDDFSVRYDLLLSLSKMLNNLRSKPVENKIREILKKQIEHYKKGLENPECRARDLKPDMAILDGFIKDLENKNTKAA